MPTAATRTTNCSDVTSCFNDWMMAAIFFADSALVGRAVTVGDPGGAVEATISERAVSSMGVTRVGEAAPQSATCRIIHKLVPVVKQL